MGAAVVLFAFTVPIGIRFYQNQVVIDASGTLVDMLQRAQAYAAAARNDSRFGVKVLPGEFVLFQGDSYAARTASNDERIEFPTYLTVSSTADEFVFSKLVATSSASGTVAFVGNGAASVVGVNAEGIISVQ